LGKNKINKEFNEIILDSIDEAFSFLGLKVKTAIYVYLERKFLIFKNDIPYRMEDFLDALERVFGIAAKPLEILIMKKLHEKIACSYKWSGPKWLIPDLKFSDYVELLRLCYEDAGKTEKMEVIVDVGETQKQKI
jgi:hypothetical protein